MKISSQSVIPPPSQSNDAFFAAINIVASPMKTIEEKIAEQKSFFELDIKDYIAYACEGSGKRLRPLLALLAGGATGNISSQHINLGLIVELIHIASLVHDDIMDGATLRRERPTLNAKWGNGLTVLVGDLLFTHALRLATYFSNSTISRRIADAAIGVCSGEMLQKERCFDLSLTLENYYRIIEMKTGSLFAVACELGALLNESPPEVVAALKQYGNQVGTAYQILDDCIDILGDEKKIGKTLGTDLVGGKFTLPILMLFEATSQEEQEIVHHARHSLVKDTGMNRETLVKMLLERGVFKKAMAEISHLLDQAEVALEILADNNYVQGLRSMIFYLRELATEKVGVF